MKLLEKYFILQLLDTQGRVVTSIYNQHKYTFKNLNPQTYQIRIIVDENNNQQWDTGNFEKNKEPEKEGREEETNFPDMKDLT